MAWIWTDPPERKLPIWADFDHTHSTFASSDVLSDQPLPSDSGIAILDAKRHKLEKILLFACLPTTCSAPVVNRDLGSLLLSQTEQGAIQLYPVTVRARDGDTRDYSFVIPLATVICTDIERSQIRRWIVPEVSAFGFTTLRHRNDCLGDHAIARDKYLRHVLVSDRLRTIMLATGDKGLAFRHPEDMKPC